MKPDRLLRNSRAHRGFRLSSLALALLIGTALTASAARPAESAQDASTDLSAPPSYPDEAHVFNGCHLSTIGYLARYLSQYPREHGEPVVINMLNAGGYRRMHTMALMSWRGQAWCRDEYFGVFALGCPFDAHANAEKLSSRAEACYQEHARKVIRAHGMPQRRETDDDLSSQERLDEVHQASRLIPYPTTIYWVRSGRKEVPVAFFRPGGRQVAVYDPLSGTCVAECSIHDDAKVVSLVAAQLGYRSDGVRLEVSIPSGTLLAAANTPQ